MSRFSPFDFVVACLLVPFAIPLVALAALAIKRDTPGPVFFVQDRLGFRQRVFRCYKLRTMSVEAPNAASHEVGSSHITRVGRVLRRYKLDELPQLINVLRGDMRFVGPRPGLPGHDALTEARARQGVFDVVPGITGLAQLGGVDMSDPERLAQVDRSYIDNRSFLGDLKLMVQTAFGRGSGDASIQ